MIIVVQLPEFYSNLIIFDIIFNKINIKNSINENEMKIIELFINLLF